MPFENAIFLTIIIYTVISIHRIWRAHIKKKLRNMDPIQYYEYHLKYIKKSEIKRLKTMPYTRYLYTTHWDLCRNAALFRDKYKCQDCYIKEKLQVHHLTYERRGFELLSDVITVCDGCHKHRHGI